MEKITRFYVIYNEKYEFDFYETGRAIPEAKYRARYFTVAAEIENLMTAQYGYRPPNYTVGARSLEVLNQTNWKSVKLAMMFYKQFMQ